MDKITELLDRYGTARAAFFTDAGIITSDTSGSPFFLLRDHPLRTKKTTIDSAFLCDEIVVIKGQWEHEHLAMLNLSTATLRSFLAQAEAKTQHLIAKAYHWLNWDKIARYCGQCGASLMLDFHTPQRICSHCKTTFFPRFSPAVMVLIQKGDKILLARSPHFTAGVYSAIAGFIDAGETAEMAAHREVKEELGIDIKDLRYFGTQAWPFPDSFLIAFTAQYAGGTLQIDPNEIEAAQWFSLHSLPTLPNSASIAYQLIHSIL